MPDSSPAKAEKRWFNYVVVRVADVRRDEFVNVGLVIVDRTGGTVHARMDPTLDRLASVLPSLPIDHIRSALGVMADTLIGEIGEGEEAIATIKEWHVRWSQKMIRTSNLRSILSTDPDTVLDKLYREYVVAPEARNAIE